MSFNDKFAEGKEAAKAAYELTDSFLCEMKVPPFLRAPIAAIPATLILAIGLVYAAFTAFIIKSAAPVAGAILRLISEVRKEGLPELGQLSAEALSEFLGTEVSAEDIPDGTGKHGNLKQVQAIGGKLHEVLTHEFAPDGVVTPQSAEMGARAFSGFNIRFSVANAFISIMSEMLSDEHLTQFRELGVEVAQNLGLGRLHRQALKPLIRNLIEEPYDQLLRHRYRPDRLGDRQYVRAMLAGKITPEACRAELAYKGLRDADIEHAISEYTTRNADIDIHRLYRWGIITKEQAIQQLRDDGLSLEYATQRLTAIELSRTDSKVNEYVNVLEQQLVDGVLSLDAFNNLLERCPLSENEKQWERNIVGLKLDSVRKQLTWAQVKAAYIDAFITLDYVDRWLEREGYGDEESLVLELELLKENNEAIEKQKAKDDKKKRADARAQAGEVSLSASAAALNNPQPTAAAPEPSVTSAAV